MKSNHNFIHKISGYTAVFSLVIALLFVNQPIFSQDNHPEHKKQVKTVNIIRKGIIDLKKIDKNKDGKVFQDQMHWNVISDSEGICPLCRMTLMEVTIKEAKENLKNNGFKFK